jgi:hypothetical protein
MRVAPGPTEAEPELALVPIEAARELSAKMLRRKLSGELKLDPDEIGIFFITPCTAIMNSVLAPVGLEQSYLDGAISISELYGPLLKAIKAGEIDLAAALNGATP